MPEQLVDEDGGPTEVCLEGDTESAQPYTVQLAQMPSGDNPATGECVITRLLGRGLISLNSGAHTFE